MNPWKADFGVGVAGVAGLFVDRFGSARLVRRYQTARLRALLRHAYETVPFYRRRFDEAGIHPDQVRTLDDLQRVPVTLKSDLRAAPEEDVLARGCDPSRLARHGTGGSTGVPIEVRFTRFEDLLLRMMRLQALTRLGLRAWDRRCAVAFSEGTGRPGLRERLDIFRNRTFHTYWPAERLRAELRDFRPHVIRGYPSALSTLAQSLTDDDRRRIRPRFITTDSENLTALSRAHIEQGFRAPVFDIYDCFECNAIAYQCPRGGQYHVMDTSIVAEVLKGDRPALPGECGEIAITSLHSWAAPLIRYMPGDIVEQGASRCPCGAPNSCLAQIYGRTQDRFRLSGELNINPNVFAGWLYPICPFLRRYQIIQEAIDRIVVKLQPSPGVELPPERVEAMRQGMARDLGEGVMLRVDLVDDIPSEPNGKFRTYRCEVV